MQVDEEPQHVALHVLLPGRGHSSAAGGRSPEPTPAPARPRCHKRAPSPAGCRHLGEAVRRKPSKRLLQKSSRANSSANSAKFPMSRCRKMSPNARSPKVSTANTGVSPAQPAAPAPGWANGEAAEQQRPLRTGCPVFLQPEPGPHQEEAGAASRPHGSREAGLWG